MQDPHVARDIAQFFRGIPAEHRDTEFMNERVNRPNFLTQAAAVTNPSIQFYRLKYTETLDTSER